MYVLILNKIIFLNHSLIVTKLIWRIFLFFWSLKSRNVENKLIIYTKLVTEQIKIDNKLLAAGIIDNQGNGPVYEDLLKILNSKKPIQN